MLNFLFYLRLLSKFDDSIWNEYYRVGTSTDVYDNNLCQWCNQVADDDPIWPIAE